MCIVHNDLNLVVLSLQAHVAIINPGDNLCTDRVANWRWTWAWLTLLTVNLPFWRRLHASNCLSSVMQVMLLVKCTKRVLLTKCAQQRLRVQLHWKLAKKAKSRFTRSTYHKLCRLSHGKFTVEYSKSYFVIFMFTYFLFFEDFFVNTNDLIYKNK